MNKEHSLKMALGLLLITLLAILLAGCGAIGAQATPLPTRTPLPTFTPTAEVAVAPQEPVQEQPAAPEQQQGEQPAAPPQDQQAAPTEEPTPEPTPTPQQAQLVLNDVVNIRSGPGTNYGLLGSGQQGTTFRITGKNPDGAWWEIDYNGRAGWVFGQLVAVTGAEGVAVAQNIPPAPTAAPAPTNTPVPAQPEPAPEQPAPEQPAPEQPQQQYKFNIVVVSRCERQPAGNWFEGRTYVNGQPQNGYRVSFSYAPDGPVVATIRSGPHEGYLNWDTGYYSHIINASGPKAGNWFVWVVDDNGQRISEIGNFQTTGPGDGCNQAVVDFDSR